MKKLFSIFSLILVGILAFTSISVAGWNPGWKVEVSLEGVEIGSGQIVNPAIGPPKPLSVILERVQDSMATLGYIYKSAVGTSDGSCSEWVYRPGDGIAWGLVWNDAGKVLTITLERDCGTGRTFYRIIYSVGWLTGISDGFKQAIESQEDF